MFVAVIAAALCITAAAAPSQCCDKESAQQALEWSEACAQSNLSQACCALGQLALCGPCRPHSAKPLMPCDGLCASWTAACGEDMWLDNSAEFRRTLNTVPCSSESVLCTRLNETTPLDDTPDTDGTHTLCALNGRTQPKPSIEQRFMDPHSNQCYDESDAARHWRASSDAAAPPADQALAWLSETTNIL
jgi:hypothetical protein